MSLTPTGLRIYIDTDVFLSAVTTSNPTAASYVLLLLSEATLIDLIASELTVEECFRNLEKVAPASSSALKARVQDIFDASISITPTASLDVLKTHQAEATGNDAYHLATAIEASCVYLVTRNQADYRVPQDVIEVIDPGSLIQRFRRAIEEGR